MAEVGSAFVSILPSARGFGSKLESEVGGEVGSAGKNTGSKFGTAFKAGAVAVLAGAAILGNFLKGAIDEAREAQVVTARTENVIKSMGLAGQVSANQIGDLAASISAKTGIDDEAIQSGQNLLLTFKNVASSAGQAGGVLEQTSGLMVDLSAAMGTDAKGAAIQLGKALNDPVKGISALTRVGVSFSESQKAQIEGFVESGNVAKAQGVILGELEKQFGGAAEAMATPADKATTAYNNLKEQIGTALLPVLDRLLSAFVAATPAISAAIAGIGPAFAQIQAFVAPVIAQIAGFFGGGGGGGGLVAGIQSFATVVGANFLPVIRTIGATFTGSVLPALQSFGAYVAANLLPVFVSIVGVVRDQVIPIVASFSQFIYGTLVPAVVQIAQAIGSKLKPIFDQLVATFQAKVLPALQQLLVKFREYQPTIEKVIGVVVKIIGKVLEFAAAILGKVLPPVIKFAGFLISNLVPAIIGGIDALAAIIGAVIDAGRTFVNAVKDVARFVSGLQDRLSEGVAFVKTIPGKILAALGNLGSILFGAGVDLILGFVNGIKSVAANVANAAKEVAQNAVSSVKGFLGIQSPSRVFAEIGRFTMEGFSKGITETGVEVREVMFSTLGASFDALRDHLTTKQGEITSVIDTLRGNFDSLRDSIAGAFSGSLFSVSAVAESVTDTTFTAAQSVSQAFANSLSDKKAELTNLLAAFRTLKGFGISSGFLSQLFASGNSALILEMASGDKSSALTSTRLFGEVQSLSTRLGRTVASNGPEFNELVRQTNRLERIEKVLKSLPKDFGLEINGATSNGMKGRVPA